MRNRLRGDFTVTKAIASVEPGPDDETGPGTFSLILSTSDMDRDGEIVDKGAFDPLPDHIAMDIDHGMSVATTVGSGRPFYNADGNLQVDGVWASTELAQNTRTLVREGHVRTASVAMLPLKKTKSEDGTTHIVKADMLNGAFTPVPSNRSATVLSAKSAAQTLDGIETLMKAGRRNSVADSAILQTIHDLVSNLGAICGNGSSEEGGSNGDPDNDGDANGVERGKSYTLAEARALLAEDATTKTTEVVEPEPDAEIESKSAAEAAAVKAAAEAADPAAELDADAWSAVALALNAARDL
jgi:hypothetical protein